MVSMKYAFDL